jgi:hypothetical protein
MSPALAEVEPRAGLFGFSTRLPLLSPLKLAAYLFKAGVISMLRLKLVHNVYVLFRKTHFPPLVS